jgi:hypothetical protein
LRKSLFSAQAAYHLGRWKEQKAGVEAVSEFETRGGLNSRPDLPPLFDL